MKIFFYFAGLEYHNEPNYRILTSKNLYVCVFEISDVIYYKPELSLIKTYQIGINAWKQ